LHEFFSSFLAFLDGGIFNYTTKVEKIQLLQQKYLPTKPALSQFHYRLYKKQKGDKT